MVRSVATFVVFGTRFTYFQAWPTLIDTLVTPCQLRATLFDTVEVLGASTGIERDGAYLTTGVANPVLWAFARLGASLGRQATTELVVASLVLGTCFVKAAAFAFAFLIFGIAD